MSLPLFWSNLKSHRWALLAWGGLLLLEGLLIVSLYPSVKSFGFMEAWLTEALPEQLRVALLGSAEGGSLFTEEGVIAMETWIGVEHLAWWPAVLAIYAILLGGGVVAREAEQGGLDLLLSQPVRRYQVLVSKFAVFVAGLVIITLASIAGLGLGQLVTGEQINYTGISLAFFQGLFLVLAIGSYSALFSALFLEPRKALLASGVVTVVMYLLNLTAGLLGPFEWLRKLSLFYYFRAQDLIQNSEPDWAGLAVYLAVAAACLLAASAIFERRDIAV